MRVYLENMKLTHDFQSIFERIIYKVVKIAAFCFLAGNVFDYVQVEEFDTNYRILKKR